jgi:hypothetical protein
MCKYTVKTSQCTNACFLFADYKVTRFFIESYNAHANAATNLYAKQQKTSSNITTSDKTLLIPHDTNNKSKTRMTFQALNVGLYREPSTPRNHFCTLKASLRDKTFLSFLS